MLRLFVLLISAVLLYSGCSDDSSSQPVNNSPLEGTWKDSVTIPLQTFTAQYTLSGSASGTLTGNVDFKYTIEQGPSTIDEEISGTCSGSYSAYNDSVHITYTGMGDYVFNGKLSQGKTVIEGMLQYPYFDNSSNKDTVLIFDLSLKKL